LSGDDDLTDAEVGNDGVVIPPQQEPSLRWWVVGSHKERRKEAC
jgi:hypothetical protein